MGALDLKESMARSAFVKLMKTKDINSADKLLSEAKSNMHRLNSLDPTWALDMGFITVLAGPNAEARVIARVLSMMPTKATGVTIAETIGCLEELTASDEMKLSPLGSQSQLKLCLGFLRTINASGIVEVKGTNKSDMLVKVHEAADNFLRIPSEGDKPPLVGSEALNIHITHAKAKMKSGTISEDEVKVLRQFFWMVKATDLVGVSDMIREFDKKQAGAAAKAKAKAKPKAGKVAPKITSDKAAKAAMDMFS